MVAFDLPTEEGRGDLTSNIALKLARQLKKKPQDIAQSIADGLKGIDGVDACEAAGGYVNVTLTSSILLQGLTHTQSACEPQKKRDEPPVIIEYSQPNIAKPLGIHHVIGTVVGQALVNFYRHAGFNVISWNYIGDWGTQFGKLAVAYQKWGEGRNVRDFTLNDLLVLYVRFHEEAEKDATLEDQGRQAFRKLEEGDKALRRFWEDVVDVTKSSLAGIYQRLHVSFDLDLGESFYEDKMQAVLEEGIKKKVFVKGKEGALIVEFPEEKYPPYLVLKGDGATLYSTRDLAQMRYRIDTYHPQAIYILTDIAQKLHFEQLEETCRMLGWELPEFENILFGRMRFTDSSMSTRKGNIINLEKVLDEATERAASVIEERGDAIQSDDPEGLAKMMGIGALVYGILSQNRKIDIVFDWKKALTFEGNSAPYLQYTHARAMSVLRKAGDEKPKLSESGDVSLAPADRALAHILLRFSDVLNEARVEKMPSRLGTYLYELAQSFNTFYNAEPILNAEQHIRAVRLYLTSLTARVLKCGASLLTLSVPDKM